MDKLLSPKITALAFGVLVVSFAVGFYVFAWQEPTEAPPEGNVPTPINVSDTPQTKKGDLTIGIAEIQGDGSMSPELNADKLDDYHAADLLAGARPQWVIYRSSEYYTGNLGGFSGANEKCNNDPNKPVGYTGYLWQDQKCIKPDGSIYNCLGEAWGIAIVRYDCNTVLLWGGDKCGSWTLEDNTKVAFSMAGGCCIIPYAFNDVGGGVGRKMITWTCPYGSPTTITYCSRRYPLYCIGFK